MRMLSKITLTICTDNLFVREGGVLENSLPVAEVAENEAEARIIAFGPLEIVDERPIEVAQ
jgi:hypothetical protein